MENVAKVLKELRDRADMTREELALAMGYARGTSISRYEDESYWGSNRYPVDFVVKLIHALVGKGEPEITAQEIAALAEPGTAVILSQNAVVAVPVIDWGDVHLALASIDPVPVLSFLQVAAIPAGRYFAVAIPRAEMFDAAGLAMVIIDMGQRELRDGGLFLFLLDGVAKLRRYSANPPCFLSEAIPPEAPILHTRTVDVIGRAIRKITEL